MKLRWINLQFRGVVYTSQAFWCLAKQRQKGGLSDQLNREMAD